MEFSLQNHYSTILNSSTSILKSIVFQFDSTLKYNEQWLSRFVKDNVFKKPQSFPNNQKVICSILMGGISFYIYRYSSRYYARRAYKKKEQESCHMKDLCRIKSQTNESLEYYQTQTADLKEVEFAFIDTSIEEMEEEEEKEKEEETVMNNYIKTNQQQPKTVESSCERNDIQEDL